jgi:phthalate 4,5-cis-dihydrodiol dehydrogenase
MVYGDDDRRAVQLAPGIAGRDLMVAELYDAVVHAKPALHSPRWARATLEVSLAVLTSARNRHEVQLRYQVPTND